MKIEIEGRVVEVDPSFANLSPQEQERTVDEIAASFGPKTKHPVMSQVNRGISDSLGGLIDFVNPFDQPHALNPFKQGTGSAQSGISNLMNRAGIEVAQGEPEAAWQAAARGAGNAAGSLIPIATGLSALRGAGGAVGQFADDAYKALASIMGTSGEIGAGAISGAAEKTAENAGLPEWAQTTAAIAAPVAAAGAVIGGAKALGAVASYTPAGTLVRKAQAAMAPYTKTGATEVARDRMQQLAGGQERAEELATRIGGDNPLNLTPAQQTGDQNMLGVERLAAEQDSVLRETLESRAAQSQSLARDSISGIGGNTEDAQKFFKQRRADFTRQLKARAEAATAAADRAAMSIDGSDPAATGITASRAINDALEEAVKEERRLWEAIPRGETVGTSGAKAVAEALVSETSYAQRSDIPRAVRDLLENADVYGETATVKEMHGLYSELRRVARSAMAGNDQNKNMARIANDVADAILDDLGASDGETATGRMINEARAFSSALHDTFDRGAPGRILKRTLDGDTAIEPETALEATVGRGGTSGAVSARQIATAGGRVADDAIQDYLAGRFNRSAFSATGEFTRAGAAAFIRDNRALISRYPSLERDILAAVNAKESADSLSKKIATRIASLENERLSAVQGFLGAKPEKAIEALFSARNPVKAARLAANEAAKDNSGAALAGLKGAISDYLIGQANTVSGGSPVFSGGNLVAALERPDVKRVVGQIFTAEERSRLRLIARELSKAQNSVAADVGSSLSGAKANRIIEYIARVVAARQGAELGGGSGGSLQTAQMASSRVRDILNSLASDRASQMIADAVTDPDLFKALLTQRGNARVEERAIPSLVPYLIGGVTAATQ